MAIDRRSATIQKLRRTQRGATLTGYALTMAVIVTASLGSMAALERNGETFLEDTGTAIGEPRPSSEEAASQGQLASLPGGLNYSNSNGELQNPAAPNGTTTTTIPPTTAAPTTAAPTTTTTTTTTTTPPTTLPPYTPVASGYASAGGGRCIEVDGSSIRRFFSSNCPQTDDTILTVKSNAGNTYLEMGGRCLTRSGNTVFLSDCSFVDLNQHWIASGSRWKHTSTNTCLDSYFNPIRMYACDGTPEQNYTLN